MIPNIVPDFSSLRGMRSASRVRIRRPIIIRKPLNCLRSPAKKPDRIIATKVSGTEMILKSATELEVIP